MQELILELIQNGALMAMLIVTYSLLLYHNSTFKNRKNWKVRAILGLFGGLISTSIYFFNIGYLTHLMVVMAFFLIFLTAIQFQSIIASVSHYIVLSVIHYYFTESFEAILFYTILTATLLTIHRFLRRHKCEWAVLLSLTSLSSILYLWFQGESIAVNAVVLLFNLVLGLFYFFLNHSVRQAFHRFYTYYKYSRRDYLTKLYNRRKLELDIQMLEKETVKNLSLAFLDVDDFKRINDTYGHPYGDHVLKVIASIILRARIVGSNAYRISGEEFCIIFKNVPPSTAQSVVEGIQRDIAEFPFLPLEHEEEVHVTMSIGVAHSTLENPPIRALVDYADQLMYAAKNSGKNQLVVEWVTDSSQKIR